MLRLPTDLVGLLRANRLAQRKARLSSEVWEDHGLVFTNGVGRPIDASNLRRTVATYAKRANVGISPPMSSDIRRPRCSSPAAHHSRTSQTCSVIATFGCWYRPTGTRSARSSTSRAARSECFSGERPPSPEIRQGGRSLFALVRSLPSRCLRPTLSDEPLHLGSSDHALSAEGKDSI